MKHTALKRKAASLLTAATVMLGGTFAALPANAETIPGRYSRIIGTGPINEWYYQYNLYDLEGFPCYKQNLDYIVRLYYEDKFIGFASIFRDSEYHDCFRFDYGEYPNADDVRFDIQLSGNITVSYDVDADKQAHLVCYDSSESDDSISTGTDTFSYTHFSNRIWLQDLNLTGNETLYFYEKSNLCFAIPVSKIKGSFISAEFMHMVYYPYYFHVGSDNPDDTAGDWYRWHCSAFDKTQNIWEKDDTITDTAVLRISRMQFPNECTGAEVKKNGETVLTVSTDDFLNTSAGDTPENTLYMNPSETNQYEIEFNYGINGTVVYTILGERPVMTRGRVNKSNFENRIPMDTVHDGQVVHITGTTENGRTIDTDVKAVYTDYMHDVCIPFPADGTYTVINTETGFPIAESFSIDNDDSGYTLGAYYNYATDCWVKGTTGFVCTLTKLCDGTIGKTGITYFVPTPVKTEPAYERIVYTSSYHEKVTAEETVADIQSSETEETATVKDRSVAYVVLLTQYLHGQQTLSPIEADILDRNNDSIINIYDLILLKRQLIS